MFVTEPAHVVLPGNVRIGLCILLCLLQCCCQPLIKLESESERLSIVICSVKSGLISLGMPT